MSYSEPLLQWIETVSSAFPKLSRPQAKVLAASELWNGDGQSLWYYAGLCSPGASDGK